MKVSQLLESRRRDWLELEQLCSTLYRVRRRAADAPSLTRFSALYRAACADLALAEAYQFPPETIRYLHRLVGRAHNCLYRSRSFTFSTWARQLLVQVPQQLFNDNYLRLAFCVFWGVFLLSAYMAFTQPGFAQRLAGKDNIRAMEEMYSQPIEELGAQGRGLMVGFYVYNNAGIGLRCFAFGLLGGVGGLLVTSFNAAFLGATFGHMATVKQWDNFSHFVTAHAPFELTAVVLSAAAGMRLGFALIDTRGMRRSAALYQAGQESLPTVCAAVILFCFAALIEAFLSPSPLPYQLKSAVAVFSTALLMFYFVGLGYPRGE